MTKQETFSIVMPTYNRREKLTQLLAMLLMQEYPKSHYEIIVSDDGSTEPKIRFINKKIIYIENQHRGVIKTVNAGLRKAKNNIVIMICDDILPDSHFLQEFNLWFNLHPNTSAITARQVPNSELVKKNIFARHEYTLCQYYFSKDLASSPIAVKREALEEIGYLDNLEGMSEDTRMMQRLTENGYTPIQSNIEVIHQQDYSLRGFVKSAMNRGKAGREFKSRSFFVLKLLATPMMFFVYLFRLRNLEMAFMHTIYNTILSLSAIIR